MIKNLLWTLVAIAVMLGACAVAGTVGMIVITFGGLAATCYFDPSNLKGK